MLGELLEDPDGVERGGVLRGMGLLNTHTRFEKAKTRTQIRGRVTEDAFLEELSGCEVEGYEIHMGRTENLGGCRETIRLEDGRTDGLCDPEGLVFGTYLHGIFDTGEAASSLVGRLMEKKGIERGSWSFDPEEHKRQEYDKLADLIRNSLNMDRIYEILEAGTIC